MKFKKIEMQRNLAGYDTQKLQEVVIQQNKTIEKSLKAVSEKLYSPKELKPLCEAMLVKKAHGKSSKDKSSKDKVDDPRFSVRKGTNAAFDHIDFKKKFINAKVKIFTQHLIGFYNEKFKNNERDYIKKAVGNSNTIHILLTGRKSKVKKDGTLLATNDHIIGAVTFCIVEKTALILWLGVSSKLYDKGFGNSNEPFLPFEQNFCIGTFLLVCVQQFLYVQKGQVFLAAQIHMEKENGPYTFYERNFFGQVDKDHPEITNLQQQARDHLLEDKNLIWMFCKYFIAELSCNWLDNHSNSSENVIRTIIKLAYKQALNKVDADDDEIVKWKAIGKEVKKRIQKKKKRFQLFI
jgi:hypothetical protein